MEKTWRWFGKNDKITLDMLKQIGVEGIVTALHDITNGEIWPLDKIMEMKNYIESYGLRWSVVESLPVSEAIKYGCEDRDRLIDNYIKSLDHLGQAGVTTVCYNFMPVIDWIRTDLNYKLSDGTETLFFDKIKFAYFDCYILERENAFKDYTPEEMIRVEKLASTITEEEKEQLVDSIIVKTQGFVNGNIKEGDDNPVALFKNLLKLYDGIDRDMLRQNMVHFLSAIMPICEKHQIRMCVHPDDPPCQVLGLPRIVTCADDVEWLLEAVDNPLNGVTFCAGSLSAGIENDVPQMAARFARRTHFVHLRYTGATDDGNFMETSHLNKRLIEVIRIFEKEKTTVPMRIDHGKMMLGDEEKGYNPGYSFHGRMFALAQVEGMLAVIEDENN